MSIHDDRSEFGMCEGACVLELRDNISHASWIYMDSHWNIVYDVYSVSTESKAAPSYTMLFAP